MVSSNEIRKKYLDFFASRGHTVIPSASLVPQNDPTTLFISSGMQPLVPYLLGQSHPAGKRLVNLQKSVRTGDIEEVGDNRHLTFFEMFGNWSLGDYFKQEQLPWVFELLTKELGLDAARIYVTVFAGDEFLCIPKDDEAVEIWKRLYAGVGIEATDVMIGSEAEGYEVGMQSGRIFYYDAKKNWWSRSGTPDKMPSGEPGGPDSEVFYEFPGIIHDPKFGKLCHPNCDCGRYIEIGNSVFMEYVKKGDGSFEKLKQRNVDFGGGFERLVAATHGSDDAYAAGALQEEIKKLEEWSGKHYGDIHFTKAFRIVADHVRAAVFLISDGVLPSNAERGYIVRRLLRRAVRFADVLGVPGGNLKNLFDAVAREYRESYPEIEEKRTQICEAIGSEESRFRETLTRGIKELEKFPRDGRTVTAQDAFVLFTTYGFPFELTQEIAKEKGIKIYLEGLDKLMEEHRDLSRAGAEQKFKGGLADQSEAVVRLHTAHHLLLKALQMVLGPRVVQRGSNITGERLRIDFAHGEKMTDEQKREVERIVNEKITEGLPVLRNTLPRAEAEKLGAEMEFGAKYPDTVTVYSVGPKGATLENPQFDKAFSMEFCGGPHVENTHELAKSGTFKIQKEEASSAGIRRIKATLQ